jgi:hypothetical protein
MRMSEENELDESALDLSGGNNSDCVSHERSPTTRTSS